MLCSTADNGAYKLGDTSEAETFGATGSIEVDFLLWEYVVWG